MLSNTQLIDTLIEDLNNALKNLCGGQYIAFTQTVMQMVQKLVNLKKGITDEAKNREEIIETLKRELRAAGREVVDIPAEELISNPDRLKEVLK